MRKGALRGGVVVGALAAAAFAWAVSPPPAKAEPECLWNSNDYDRDGIVDVAVGAPGTRNGTGEVMVRVSHDGDPHWYSIAPTGGQAGEQFGAAIAEVAATDGEINQERCSQLVIGAPGRDVNGNADAGAVYVYEFTNFDQGFELVKRYTQGSDGVPGTAQAGARFGAALAAPYHLDDIGPIQTPLYVGAPGYTVGTAKGAGAFLRLKFSVAQDQTVEEGALMTQGSGKIPGSAEAGDAFGSSLATTQGGVFVGAPREDVGTAKDAGGFVRWRERDSADAKFYTQNTDGVPGAAEAGDQFGAAIYASSETEPDPGGDYVMVGAPGEAIGSVAGAGSAVRFVYRGDFEMSYTKGFSQNTSGISGTAETNDHFGSSFSAFGQRQILVGVPDEDVLGDVKDAGLVQSLDGQSWQQDSPGVDGTAEAGDRFGATMSNALLPQVATDDGWLSVLLIGVPGEDAGAGSVIKGLPGGSGSTEEWKFEVYQPGDHFGAALGKTN